LYASLSLYAQSRDTANQPSETVRNGVVNTQIANSVVQQRRLAAGRFWSPRALIQ
jgi:hypothetical protein